MNDSIGPVKYKVRLGKTVTKSVDVITLARSKNEAEEKAIIAGLEESSDDTGLDWQEDVGGYEEPPYIISIEELK